MPHFNPSTNVRQRKEMIALFHVVICPKYRLDLLRESDIAQAAESLMRYIATYHGIQIHAMAVQPDHVHIFMAIPRTRSIAWCVQQIKSFSSLRLRQRFAFLKWRCDKAFWSVRYYYHSESVSTSNVTAYIEKQMRHYDSSQQRSA